MVFGCVVVLDTRFGLDGVTGLLARAYCCEGIAEIKALPKDKMYYAMKSPTGSK